MKEFLNKYTSIFYDTKTPPMGVIGWVTSIFSGMFIASFVQNYASPKSILNISIIILTFFSLALFFKLQPKYLKLLNYSRWFIIGIMINRG